ncbi:unnamed protein product [Alternaria alternata]
MELDDVEEIVEIDEGKFWELFELPGNETDSVEAAPEATPLGEMLLAKAWLDPSDSDAPKAEGNPGGGGVNEVTRDVADTDAVPRDEFTLGVDVVG